MTEANEHDEALAAVARWMMAADPDGERSGRVVRQTFDQLYDGGRTGRFRWEELFKTEKTHFGTLVEINLQREFEFDDGRKLDYRIAGHEVDAKYSDRSAWMLPPEVVGHLCLLVTASDVQSQFSIGIVRASAYRLNLGANRDAKKTLNATGRAAIHWLHRHAELPVNVLLHLPAPDLAAVLAVRAGQGRVNELFRRTIGRKVSRTAVETAGMQLDPMKRVRLDGGSRQHLAPEGIAIFGGTRRWQREAAVALGLPEPKPSEFVAVYLRPASEGGDGPAVRIRGWSVRRATANTAKPIPLGLYAEGRFVVRRMRDDAWRA